MQPAVASEDRTHVLPSVAPDKEWDIIKELAIAATIQPTEHGTAVEAEGSAWPDALPIANLCAPLHCYVPYRSYAQAPEGQMPAWDRLQQI